MSTSAKGLTEKAIKDNKVMVFSKSYCPYCAKTKSTLQGLGIKFGVFELDVSALHMIITI
jgi:glutaredoxin 3